LHRPRVTFRHLATPTLTKERRIAGPAEIIDCVSDKHAIEEAKILMDGYDVEVWKGTRIVMRLRPSGH
jgi:hypothetical protein